MRERDIEQVFLLGDEGESARWVALVRHRADDIARRLFGVATLTQRVMLPNGWAIIKIRRGRRKYFIYTEPGGPGYEFFSSEDIYIFPYGSPPHNDPQADLYICGKFSWHKAEGGEIKSQPLVEFCGESCPDDNLTLEVTWPVVDCDSVAYEDLTKTPTGWQNQRSWEHVWYPGNSGGTFVISAAGAVPGYSSIGKLSRWNAGVGEVQKRFFEDVGFDLKPGLYGYRATTPSAYGAPALTEPNYYRRACTLVKDGITFIVMTDSEGEFYFWKAAVYAGNEVPQGEYVKATPPYPTWADRPNGKQFWNFNKDGTKAVCCPFTRYDAPNRKNGDASYKYSLNTFLRADVSWPEACRTRAKEYEPGIFEISIDVIIYADGSFEPVLTSIREERFSVNGHYSVAADYLINDARLPYPEDTLVMLTYDLWIEGGDYDWLNASSYYYPDDYSAITRDGLVILAEVFDEDIQQYVWEEAERTKLVCRWNVGMWATSLGATYETEDPLCGSPSPTAIGDTITEYSILYYGFAATISNLNLKTLSWVRRCNVPYDPFTASDIYVGDEYVAYGEVVETRGDPEAIAGQPTLWETLGYVRADLTKYELFSNGYHNCLDSAPYMGMSWHPKGHWSASTPVINIDDIPGWSGHVTGVRVVDMVNFRINGQDVRTTHKDLFNAAFGSTREYTYYSDFDDPNSKYEGFGTFRTFGIFRDK